MNSTLFKPLLLLTFVLAAPVLMIVVWGEPFAAELRQWQESPPSQTALALIVVTVLAADVFLPVPSGPLSTLAGSQLGALWGTLVSTIGMTLGAALAFALARRWGWPLARRFATAAQLAEAEIACQQHGTWALVLTRPLPILAEACTLLAGGLQMRWRQFLPPVVGSNVLIAAVYSVLGEQAGRRGWLPLAICAAAAAPLAVLVWIRRGPKR